MKFMNPSAKFYQLIYGLILGICVNMPAKSLEINSNTNLNIGENNMVAQKSKNTKVNNGIWECTLSDLKTKVAGEMISGSPALVDSPYGKAVWFDGIDDGYFLENNPLNGLSCFTIEAIICPDADGPFEQRFLHIGGTDSDRLLLELRLTPENNWYLDTFILCGESKQAVIDPQLLHPAGKWYHVVLTLDKTGKMTNYINGKVELTGNVSYRPINSGAMSLGARRNKVSWFKGAIYKVKITPEVLEPKGFMPF
jgi:hypothetical protein